MSYTLLQMRRIREALLRYKGYGSDEVGRELSWAAVVGAIEMYTSYVIDPANERRQLANDAEKLRQFVLGTVPARGQKPRKIDDIFLRSIVEFLSHSEVGLIDIDESFPDDVSYVLAKDLNDHFSDARAPRDAYKKTALVGSGVGFTPMHMLERIYPFPGVARLYTISHITISARKFNSGLWCAEILFKTPVATLNSAKPDRRMVGQAFIGSLVYTKPDRFIMIVRDRLTFESKILLAYESYVETDISKVAILEIAPTSGNLTHSDSRYVFDNSDLRSYLSSNPVLAQAFSYMKQEAMVVDLFSDPDKTIDTEKEICIIFSDFDPNKAVSSVQFQMHEQVIIEEKQKYWRDIYLSKIDKTLLDSLKSMELWRISELHNDGARFDYQDEITGATALHLLAQMGWRDGMMLALSDPDRCNFSLRDNDGRLPSYYAFVHGGDAALARLLRMKERATINDTRSNTGACLSFPSPNL